MNAAMQSANAQVAQSTDAHFVAVQSQSWLRSGVAPLLASLADDIARITGYYDNFSGAILDVEKLLETKVDAPVSGCLYRLLHVNVITALETYLSDAFINTVVPNSRLMRRFVETTPEFQVEKIALADVFKAMEDIEGTGKAYLVDLVWHHLERVRPMYGATLGIEFPSDAAEIFRAVRTRHDIVHRNGKTKDGVEINVTKSDIQNLIAAVEGFVQHIDKQISRVKTS
jgi:hypothetical protein